MENEKKEKLSNFLINRTEKDVLSRGRSIYSSGGFKVSKLEYNGPGNAEFKLKSDYSIQYYIIQIKDFLTPQISTSCTCSFNYGGLCKHRVAAILYILDKMPAIQQVQYQMEKTVVDLAEIRDYTLKNLVLDDTWGSRGDITKVDIESAKEGEATCIVHHHEQDFTVSFTRLKSTKQLSTTCSCNQKLWVPLCEHKLAALLKLREDLGERAFEVMRDLTAEKSSLLAEYGYSLEDNIQSKFDFKLDEDGVLHLIKLDQAIQKVGSYQDWEGLRERILPVQSISYQVSTSEGAKDDEDRVSLFVFWPKGKEHLMDFGFGAFSAKYSHKTQKITSIRNVAGGSSHYYAPDEIPVLTEAEVRLVRIARHLEDGLQKFIRKQGGSYNAYMHFSDVNYYQQRKSRDFIGKQVTQIFNDLDEHWVYIAENDFISTNNHLTKVRLHREPAKLFFVLTEDNEFVTLNPYVEIRKGSPVELSKVAAFDSFWLGLYQEDMLFRWATTSDAEMVAYMRENGFKIRVRKEYSDEFLKNWIMPVTEQFDVIFQTRHAIETLPMKLLKSRIYLKEDDANLLIVPMYVYEGEEPESEVEMVYDQRRTKAGFEDNKITMQERDADTEQALWRWLESLHPDFSHQAGNPFFYVPFEHVMKDGWLFKFVEAVNEQKYELLGFRELKKMKFNPNRGQFNVKASSGIDWFDMQIDITFGDQRVSLAEAKKALLKKQNYVQLKDGSLGMLPEEWIKKLEPLLMFGRIDGDELHLSKIHFSLIDELVSQVDNEEVFLELQEKKQKLLNFKEIPNVPLPENLNATLRHYQEEGYKWINFLHEFGWSDKKSAQRHPYLGR